jgi:lysophospholipase L1-like esterase
MRRLQFHVLCVVLLSMAQGCATFRATEKSQPSSVSMNQSAARHAVFDPAFQFDGRIDARDLSAPVLIWQGSRVLVDFDGTELTLCFGAAKGVSFFDIEVDGDVSVVEVKESAVPVQIKYSKLLSAGRHRLRLFKRSEADAGHAAFLGVELAAGANVFAPELITPKLALQFFGDSITVGACNEDGAVDQWENRATHNNALSYGALTAKALSAGYRNVAVSGMGIVVGYVPKRAGEICDRLYPEPGAPRSDERGWSPDVVFVNYGENDDSFSKNQNMEFPAGFADGYVALVQGMRAAYPQAEIVLLRGGMFGGAKSEALRTAWETAVQRLEAEDGRVHHFVFQHWSELHPRVSDHQAMAEELVAWLKTQPFMQRFE